MSVEMFRKSVFAAANEMFLNFFTVGVAKTEGLGEKRVRLSQQREK